MNSRLGIELGARVIRAVRLDGWARPRRTARVAEVEWDGSDPQDAVRELRAHLGPANAVGVAVDLSLLFVKQVKLPPLSAADKANIIRVEPERFFPVRAEDLVPATRTQDDLVFAAREAPLTAWVAALEALGTVDRVEPGPVALSRALARADVTAGTALIDGQEVIELREGRVARARRVYGELADTAAAVAATSEATVYVAPWDEQRVAALRALLPETRVVPMPTAGGVPALFLPAYGAALATGGGNDDQAESVLHSVELQARIARRRRRAVTLASAICAAALFIVILSAGGWRARVKHRLDRDLQTLNAQATPALALQTQLATMQRVAAAVGRIESDRPDPMKVLLALSQRLPRGASIRTINAAGAEWRLEGFAPNAAQLLGLLAAAPDFHDVRFLSATNRAVVGTRTYENFALAFRYTPAP
ncbi:MAG: hypothetical protein AUI08_12270 [Gemmatimonadetes bacterium 13_2_20CM_2_65_7]|nr:MAG: hypothetical protein AUI08_12270 [Gemmatimonadetes bacterium 13_2_20CM_2_65_7]OLC99199.1 MAG: hypothetical protein AUI89_09405 [Gemmatimonadetes bacterium 13_1_40CM_3_65_8]